MDIDIGILLNSFDTENIPYIRLIYIKKLKFDQIYSDLYCIENGLSRLDTSYY
jgi:hypothetical protein